MTFRKPVATTWKMNENQFRRMFLNPWHMLSYIWVHFGLWRPIFTVKLWFSHIFPASAWLPFLSVNLTDKLARLVLFWRSCKNSFLVFSWTGLDAIHYTILFYVEFERSACTICRSDFLALETKQSNWFSFIFEYTLGFIFCNCHNSFLDFPLM